MIFPWTKKDRKDGLDFIDRERRLRDAVIAMAVNEGPKYAAMRLDSYVGLLVIDGPFRQAAMELWTEGKRQV